MTGFNPRQETWTATQGQWRVIHRTGHGYTVMRRTALGGYVRVAWFCSHSELERYARGCADGPELREATLDVIRRYSEWCDKRRN